MVLGSLATGIWYEWCGTLARCVAVPMQLITQHEQCLSGCLLLLSVSGARFYLCEGLLLMLPCDTYPVPVPVPSPSRPLVVAPSLLEVRVKAAPGTSARDGPALGTDIYACLCVGLAPHLIPSPGSVYPPRPPSCVVLYHTSACLTDLGCTNHPRPISILVPPDLTPHHPPPLSPHLHRRPRHLVVMATVASRRGQDALAALNAFGAILHRRPRSPRALWGRARALNAQAAQERSNNALDKAIKAFRGVLDLDLETPVPPELYRRAAETCVQQMRFRGRREGRDGEGGGAE